MHLDDIYGNQVTLLISNHENILQAVIKSHLVIGSVLIPGARAPRLITREMVRAMKAGSVIVDVSIDQGGSCETSRPTTHQNPTFVVDGVLHYGVPNMPGVVSRTSTFALTNITLPYALKLADQGIEKAIAEDQRSAR
jgi:alanine dehydrogenase